VRRGRSGWNQRLYAWDKGMPNDGHTTTQFTVHLGGSDGQGGDGGVVSLQNTGDVTTRGSLSHGMVAQSIGGGGGVAGAVVKPVALDDTSDPSGALTTESAQFLHVGGAPGEDAVMGAGNSNPLKEQDAVSVAMLGSIATGGDWAMGLLAQAIGGGGGSGYVGAL